MKSPTMKIDADEKELLESVERGEWESAGAGKRERARYIASEIARGQGGSIEVSSLAGETIFAFVLTFGQIASTKEAGPR